MTRQEVPIENATTIEIIATGNLTVEGRSELAIWLDDEAEERGFTPIERTNGVIRLTLQGDGRLVVPERFLLRLPRIGGDCRIIRLGNGLEIGEITGDTTLQRIDGRITFHAILGNLRLREGSGALQGEQIVGDFTAEKVGGTVTLSARIGGDARLTDIGGKINLGGVIGDLEIRDCQEVEVGTISGDARIREARGSVSLQRVDGDVKISDCPRLITIEHIGADLSAANTPGGLIAPRVGGDLRLRTGFDPGSTYRVNCTGSARIAVAAEPGQVSARFELRSTSERIYTDLPLNDIERESGALRGQLSDGSATVQIESTGPIVLSAREGETEGGFMTGFFEDLGKDLASAFGSFAGVGGPEFEKRIRDEAEKISRRATDQAVRASERAQRHIERMARQAERRAGQWGAGGGGWWRQGPAAPPPPSRPPTPPPQASTEERLLILRLLAEGKISAEEAARLLDTLGG